MLKECKERTDKIEVKREKVAKLEDREVETSKRGTKIKSQELR